MSHSGTTPSLTPSRSPSPIPPVQPDHFYGSDGPAAPQSPDSDGKTWLDPDDDPLAQRGIPVFKPTIDEFSDFEGYMQKIECWGTRSGIVKIIPPKEWRDALPSLTDQLANARIKNPIEQHMLGRGGLFRQQNIEKRRFMSVREWAELCAKEDFQAPGVDDLGLHHAGSGKETRRRGRRTKNVKTDTLDAEAEAEPDEGVEVIKQEPGLEEELASAHLNNATYPSTSTPPSGSADATAPSTHERQEEEEDEPNHPESHEHEEEEEDVDNKDNKAKPKRKRVGLTREAREANLALRAQKDTVFLETFDPHSDWLPANTTPFDYTPDMCQKLERRYWRNCGLGRPAWYGADMAGSLFTDETKKWNVAHLPSTLSRLLPPENGLPGVNTPYLYFGMWRATFAWHVEDMDLFSINYIHFGAGKFWYACPQARAGALEQTMKSYFPKDTSQCPQFLRHKSFLASPTLLSQSSCRPNTLVQHAGEFVITFPRGYHAGFNLGFNCAESVNFALDSWLNLGRKARACECIGDSVKIDVDQLLRDREKEKEEAIRSPKKDKSPTKPRSSKDKDKDEKPKLPRKRKSEAGAADALKKSKKMKTGVESAGGEVVKPKTMSVTLKLPKEPEPFPCCLCVSRSEMGLLRVQDPPAGPVIGGGKTWRAHADCASVVPETWTDEVDGEGGTKEMVVFGVDGIVRDRWNLKCSACSKTRHKAHGAPIQCTKGKCPKAFHVSCARDGEDIVYEVLREVEKEVLLIDVGPRSGDKMDVDGAGEGATSSAAGSGDGRVATSTEPTPAAEPCVLKVIRKAEVHVLCPQHNPAVAEAKKASKLDKVRQDLLALPEMTRIKIRVSAGIFEVSLVRVLEANKSVEVLWDRGIKREFKWGSVVFGSTEGQTIGQKPSEPAPESEQRSRSHSVVTSYPPNKPAFRANLNPPVGLPPLTARSYPPPAQQPYQPRTGVFSYGQATWPHQQYQQVPQPPPPQQAGPSSYGQPYSPYPPYYASTSSSGAYSYGAHSHSQPYQQSQPQTHAPQPPPTQWHHWTPPYGSGSHGQSQYHRTAPQTQQPLEPPAPPAPVLDTHSRSQQPSIQDLSALAANLHPSQIEQMLRDNPAVRDMVQGLVQQQSHRR